MANKSGRFGVVDAIHGVQNWNFTNQSEASAYYASHGRGGALRLPGIQDWSGQFTAMGGEPTLMPGDEFTFTGYTAPTTDVEGTAGPTYEGPAICDNWTLNINWETNDPLTYALSFSGNGEYGETEDSVADASVTPDYTASDCKIMFGTGSGEFEICAKSAALNISAANAVTANSCSGGFKKRAPGPIDWNLSIVVDEESQAAYDWAIDDLEEIYVWINDTKFWTLKYGQFKGFSGLTTDLGGAIIGQTLTWDMAGVNRAGTIGTIIKPDTAVWYPFS